MNERFIKNPAVAYALHCKGITVTPHSKEMIFPCGCGCYGCSCDYSYTQHGYKVAATAAQLTAMGIKSSAASNCWYAY